MSLTRSQIEEVVKELIQHGRHFHPSRDTVVVHKVVNYLTEELSIDPIIESVICKYRQRSKVGLRKYGTNLERTDLTELYWLRHAQEEALDLAAYLEKLIQEKEKGTWSKPQQTNQP